MRCTCILMTDSFIYINMIFPVIGTNESCKSTGKQRRQKTKNKIDEYAFEKKNV